MRIRRFFETVYHDNALRRQNRRALSRDLGLYLRNRAVQPIDAVVSRLVGDATLPIVFIVGPPRSGTTLTFQLLARGLPVGYPTNAVARWFSAPAIGSLVHGPKPWTRARSIPLRSEYGGTEGADAPHEFSWFWNYHAPFPETDDLTDAELDALPWGRLRRSLAAMAGLAGAPIVLKSLNWTVYNVARFARELPQARFVRVTREPRFVVQSILRCRAERYGDERRWWTIRPRDVDAWRQRDPVDQVCHQVTDIERALEAACAQLPSVRLRTVAYEDLVETPARFLDEWATWLGVDRIADRALRPLPSANRVTCSPERMAAIDRRLDGDDPR